MKFPGKRKNQHFFPVGTSSRLQVGANRTVNKKIYIVGIDQLIVDIEVLADDRDFLKFPIHKGESVLLPDSIVEEMYQYFKENKRVVGEFAGGAIGNTLHNYSVLSDDTSFVLGTISKQITVGDYAFKYVCTTNSHVDLSYLAAVEGRMARAICLVSEDGERTFAVGKGIMNELFEEQIPFELIKNCSSLLISAYLLRNEETPIFKATLKAVAIAKENNVPVVLSLGTKNIIVDKKEFFTSFISENVNVLAMNEDEAYALVGEKSPLLACQNLLDLTDMVILTVGAKGLYIAAHVDQTLARETKDQIFSKSILEYNKFEYSRAQLRSHCQNPFKIYSHINPYLGGPAVVRNTNGAGDAALSAVLHDMAANSYHRQLMPESSKHSFSFLTYSSIHQISKYANRTSFEVLKQNSPRLSQGLPEKEESLEESYWAQ